MNLGIIDFDDTLFPTAHFNLAGRVLDREEMSVLDATVRDLLVACGTVVDYLCILTCANESWIVMALTWMPRTARYMSDNGIRVHCSEAQTGQDCAKRKEAAMEWIVSEAQISTAFDSIRFILSIGDSSAERQAVLSIAEKQAIPYCRIITLQHDEQRLPLGAHALALVLDRIRRKVLPAYVYRCAFLQEQQDLVRITALKQEIRVDTAYQAPISPRESTP